MQDCFRRFLVWVAIRCPKVVSRLLPVQARDSLITFLGLTRLLFMNRLGCILWLNLLAAVSELLPSRHSVYLVLEFQFPFPMLLFLLNAVERAVSVWVGCNRWRVPQGVVRPF